MRKRINFRLCNTTEKVTTLASRPEFLSSTIFNEDLVGIKLTKEKLTLNKPIYIGQTVLELSKLEMYLLRYQHLPKYENQFNGAIQIAGGDTDSFFLRVNGIDVNKDLLPQMKRDQLLDSSNFPLNHPLFSNECKARLGCVKDEAEGMGFLEWVLLRPKCYSMLTSDKKEKKRAKGVRRFTLVKEIRHHHYREAYENQVIMTHEQKRIGSKLHQNFTINYFKKTLSFWEDKRAWVGNNSSLPYGNHNLTKERRPISLKPSHVTPPVCLQPAVQMQDDDDDNESTADCSTQSSFDTTTDSRKKKNKILKRHHSKSKEYFHSNIKKLKLNK